MRDELTGNGCLAGWLGSCIGHRRMQRARDLGRELRLQQAANQSPPLVNMLKSRQAEVKALARGAEKRSETQQAGGKQIGFAAPATPSAGGLGVQLIGDAAFGLLALVVLFGLMHHLTMR